MLKRLVTNAMDRKSWTRLPRLLEPDEKVRTCVGMTDVVTRICADGVRESHPNISEKELISILRRRFSFGRTERPDEE